jgi:hypothetical protein
MREQDSRSYPVREDMRLQYAFWAWERALTGRLRRARVTEDEVLEAARHSHGLERMDQIKFAILEASGRISIIPRSPRDKPDAPASAG